MEQVKISVNKLDTLAQTVSTKSGEALPLTIDEMNTAVANIQTGGGGNMQVKSETYTPTETTQTDSITPSTGYDGLSEVDITVNAVSSTYVGSAIDRNDSTDLTASGATVTAPSGYYENSASKTVQSGTEGTPTATKGTVSNHAIAVTPSVTNSEGYISGSTKTGTAVSVSASEVTSGTKSITSNGTNIDVVNYAAVDVSVPSQADADFVVEIDYNDQTDQWEPLCSFSDISTAFYAGKMIGVYNYGDLPAIGGYNSEDDVFIYTVEEQNVDGSNYYSIDRMFYMDANGITEDPDTTRYYNTSFADATASEVASGSKFFTNTGYAVGTATRRTSSDLQESGATVTAPAGFYASSATKTIASGSATTPTTTITAYPTISISNSGLIESSVSATEAITPTVSAGYVSSGTAGNVTVSGYANTQLTVKTSTDLQASGATVTAPAGYYTEAASKSVATMTLPSSTSSTSSGTSKATISRNTADRYLNIPTGFNSTAQYYKISAVPNGTEGTPTATKGAVSNHAIAVTPSVTNSEGYISGGTKTGTAVTVSASELVSGSETKTANGTYDVTNLAQLIVNVSGGGSSGLEYETGTWTPTADTADAWVDLSKTYTTPPFFYQIWDDTGTYDSTQNVNYSVAYFQGDRVFNNGLRKGSSSSTGYQYGWCYGYYRGTSTSSLSSFTLAINYAKSNTSTSGANYPRYWATESKIRASTNYASRVWKSTRTYKYIAIWAPTT